MPRKQPTKSNISSPTVTRPHGAPDWVTGELLAETIAAWQPYYAEDLTADQALEILLAAGRLFEVLGAAEDEEEPVLGPGPRQQP